MKKKMIFSTLIILVLAIVGYGVFARSPSLEYGIRYDKVSRGEIYPNVAR